MNIHKKASIIVKNSKKGGGGLQAGGMNWVIQGGGRGQCYIMPKEWGNVLVVGGQPIKDAKKRGKWGARGQAGVGNGMVMQR